MLTLKEKIYSVAFQVSNDLMITSTGYHACFDSLQHNVCQTGSGGTRLLALKFVEAVILLYTPDPNGSSEPPPHDGNKILLCISGSEGLKGKEMPFRYVNTIELKQLAFAYTAC